MFKLIATDIDGTFFDDDHDYDHERFNRQLKLLHEQGVKFAIASGNYLGHLQRVVQFSPVDAFVSENGAHIMAGDDEVFASYLKSDTVNAIIDGLDSLGDNLQSFILSGEEATYVDSKFEPFLNKYYIHNYQLTDDVKNVSDDVFKVNISLNDDKLDEVTADLNSRFADEIHATASGFGSIDIISKGINKAFGLQKLADFYGIGLDEIVSFGDNSNDDEMLAETGLGFAMKNAKASTQKAADHVTEFDNNYQGVLETIDSIFGFNTK
ncbi:HAD family hydrolase [Companilactobacillus zhongbaensis]|uniref:HAD family hydrolase n=1 Tax=Companilactobacillus zhongbaensis TaxID=2486009 RepID=UPI000F78466E|nr:HAD family hydrolase [Companilactobacillus zhongbaensis]